MPALELKPSPWICKVLALSVRVGASRLGGWGRTGHTVQTMGPEPPEPPLSAWAAGARPAASAKLARTMAMARPRARGVSAVNMRGLLLIGTCVGSRLIGALWPQWRSDLKDLS